MCQGTCVCEIIFAEGIPYLISVTLPTCFVLEAGFISALSKAESSH